jgi:hypothetical protein
MEDEKSRKTMNNRALNMVDSISHFGMGQTNYARMEIEVVEIGLC